MEDHVSLFDRAFGLVIAFLLPGLVPLAGLAAASATVRSWFVGVQAGPTVAGLAFVLLAALAIGVTVTAVRYCIFERLTRLVPEPSPIDEARRAEQQSTYVRLQVDHYFHYLAYGNMAVALPLAALTWYVFADRGPTGPQALAGVALVTLLTAALGMAAKSAITRYDTKRAQLFGLRAA